jgi:hypothetical protein
MEVSSVALHYFDNLILNGAVCTKSVLDIFLSEQAIFLTST